MVKFHKPNKLLSAISVRALQPSEFLPASPYLCRVSLPLQGVFRGRYSSQTARGHTKLSSLEGCTVEVVFIHQRPFEVRLAVGLRLWNKYVTKDHMKVNCSTGMCRWCWKKTMATGRGLYVTSRTSTGERPGVGDGFSEGGHPLLGWEVIPIVGILVSQSNGQCLGKVGMRLLTHSVYRKSVTVSSHPDTQTQLLLPEDGALKMKCCLGTHRRDIVDNNLSVKEHILDVLRLTCFSEQKAIFPLECLYRTSEIFCRC